MFQMDSNSGQPFFGVDLLRSKTAQRTARPNADASKVVTQVRNGPTSSVKPVTAVAEARSTEPTLLERLKLKRPPERISLSLSEADDEAVEGPVEEFR